MKRIDIKAVLSDPVLRRRLLAHCLQATQAREGRQISLQRAYEVYDKVHAEMSDGQKLSGR